MQIPPVRAVIIGPRTVALKAVRVSVIDVYSSIRLAYIKI
jgi:hypothetical protein